MDFVTGQADHDARQTIHELVDQNRLLREELSCAVGRETDHRTASAWVIKMLDRYMRLHVRPDSPDWQDLERARSVLLPEEDGL